MIRIHGYIDINNRAFFLGKICIAGIEKYPDLLMDSGFDGQIGLKQQYISTFSLEKIGETYITDISGNRYRIETYILPRLEIVDTNNPKVTIEINNVTCFRTSFNVIGTGLLSVVFRRIEINYYERSLVGVSTMNTFQL